MSRISLFGIGQLSKSAYVTAKQIINAYCEKRPDGEKSSLVCYQTPGEILFASMGDTPLRGAIEFEPGNVAYFVHRGTLWEINNAGVTVSRGTLLSTAGRVSLSHNGVQVMIVDGASGYIYNTSTLAFAQITDPDFPANPTTVTYLSRRFIVSLLNSSRFYCSDIDNGLSWDALNFANAETNPDPIIAVWASNGQLILMGAITCEYWGNSGALDFPFSLIPGTATEWGLAARWSIAKYDNTLAYLVKNRMGQVMLAKLSGYLPERVSTPDFDAIINAYPDTANASAYSYMLGGHPMYVINFPSAGTGATWLYDGSTGFFAQLKSSGSTRHNAEFSFTLLGRTLVADSTTGNIYTLTAAALTDNGASIVRELVSETIADADQNWIPINVVRLDIEAGVGLAVGQGSNPQIGMQVSRDNGKTWGPQMWKTMGAVGEYRTRCEWRRLGTARFATFRFAISDPVPFTIVDACVNPVT